MFCQARLDRTTVNSVDHGRGRGRPASSESDWPGLPAEAHVPEHPLVAARRAEMPADAVALGGGHLVTEPVGDGDYLACLVAELLGPVGVNPALVVRVR